MPILANPKHEQFAQGCANGLFQVDAYESAGYGRSPSAASQLANKEEVRMRILEIIEEKQRVADHNAKNDPNQPLTTGLTFEWLVQMLMKNIDLAQKGGQISAANKAVELLAEMHAFVAKKGSKKKAGQGGAAEEAEPEAGPTDDLGKLADVLTKLHEIVPEKKIIEAAE